jgi:hypothetical protein
MTFAMSNESKLAPPALTPSACGTVERGRRDQRLRASRSTQFDRAHLADNRIIYESHLSIATSCVLR